MFEDKGVARDGPECPGYNEGFQGERKKRTRKARDEPGERAAPRSLQPPGSMAMPTWASRGRPPHGVRTQGLSTWRQNLVPRFIQPLGPTRACPGLAEQTQRQVRAHASVMRSKRQSHRKGQARCYGSPIDGHCIQASFPEETIQDSWSPCNEETCPGRSAWPSWGC